MATDEIDDGTRDSTSVKDVLSSQLMIALLVTAQGDHPFQIVARENR